MAQPISFDNLASQYDANAKRDDLHGKAARAMLEAIKFESSMNVMEFGAGTGLLTSLFHEKVGSVVCVDASQGMLDELGKKASEGGWKNVKSACMMLESPAQLAPFGAPFNLILSAMTFHHIEDVSSILRLLYDCLKPGGVLCFVDLEFTHESHEMHKKEVYHLVKHHGFTPAQIKGWMESVGFKNVHAARSFSINKPIEAGGFKDFPIVLAHGVKP